MKTLSPQQALLLLPALTLALAAGPGCGSAADTNNSIEPAVVKSDKQRITEPQVEQSTLAQLSASNTDFALDLYQALPPDGNLFYSPISISLALAMTYAGAQGNTAAELAQALHFDLPDADLHPAFNSLDLALASRGQGAEGKDGEGFRLKVVNAIWGQQDYFFEPTFLDTLALNYGAGLRLMDFSGQPEGSRLTINGWVEEQTEQRIKDLIPEGLIDSLTRLVLTNAIYFNAAWDKKFDKSQTQAKPFQRADGSQVNAQMMRKVEKMGYAAGADWQAVDMPYDGGELSLLLVLPAADKLAQVAASLDSAALAAMEAALQTHEVTLELPQFKVESKFALKEMLGQLGIKDAFVFGPADFSGMTGTKELFIGEVIHQSFVEVDEEGTEAAAATAVIMPEGSALEEDPQVTVRLDRPFLFFVRDRATGAVLFVGRILDPTA